MSKKIEALRGMDDILPGEIEKWQWLEEQARLFFQGYGFKEIRTPLLEHTDLFSRSIGEASDIVHKEMFSFEDRGGRHVTLRPEMTASVARCVIEKGLLSQAKSLRFFYMGPMFRAERPQAGRKRQFHQIGIEIINEAGQAPDLESIRLLHFFLKSLGVPGLKLRVNDLGDQAQQQKTAENLRDYFSKQKNSLCKDCHYRLEKNVLRIFDCKNESCQPVIDQAPWEKIAPLGQDFQAIIERLKTWEIPFEVKRRLVRGLDYYNGLVFEVAADGLGAQDALAGGGRYDRLYSDLGEKSTPAIGFSIGMERLLTALGDTAADKARENLIYFAPIVSEEEFSDKAKNICQLLSQTISKLGALGMKPVLGDPKLKLDDHLKRANKMRARYVIILGSDEAKNKQWTLKDMDNKSQKVVSHGQLFSELKQVNV